MGRHACGRIRPTRLGGPRECGGGKREGRRRWRRRGGGAGSECPGRGRA